MMKPGDFAHFFDEVIYLHTRMGELVDTLALEDNLDIQEHIFKEIDRSTMGNMIDNISRAIDKE